MNLTKKCGSTSVFYLDLDVMLSDESANEGSDAWLKLEISPKAIGSVPYSNFRINVYQHSGNRKTGASSGENKFYYAPIALLDISSAVSSFNNATNQAEMKFRIEMWNEDIQSAVARWIKQEVDDTVKDSLVQVIPFEKLILAGKTSGSSVKLPRDWMPYQLQKDIRVKLTCFTKLDCDQLLDQIHQNPDILRDSHLRVLFNTASEKTFQKQVNITTSSIQLSEFVTRLEQRLPQSEFALLNPTDEQRILSEFAAAIIADAFDDIDVVPANSEAQLLKPIKDVLISTGKTIKDQGDKLWASSYWRDENSRPDKSCKTWSEIYKNLDAEKQKNLIDAFDTNSAKRRASAEQVRNLLTLIREGKLLHDQMVADNDEALNRFYDDSKDTIQWAGKEFVPKAWSPTKLDMVKLRNPNSLKDKNVKVKYSKAALSVAVNIPQTFSSFSGGSLQTPMVRGKKSILQ